MKKFCGYLFIDAHRYRGRSRRRKCRVANTDVPEQFAEPLLLHSRRRFEGCEPASLAIRFLRPLGKLSLDSKKKNRNVADDGPAGGQALFVPVAPDASDSRAPDHTSFFEGFPLCDLVRLSALLRPALWNDPSPGLARRDQHDLNRAEGDLNWQGCDLSTADWFAFLFQLQFQFVRWRLLGAHGMHSCTFDTFSCVTPAVHIHSPEPTPPAPPRGSPAPARSAPAGRSSLGAAPTIPLAGESRSAPERSMSRCRPVRGWRWALSRPRALRAAPRPWRAVPPVRTAWRSARSLPQG